MAFYCAHCGHLLNLVSASGLSRRETCPQCNADLHCCLNCRFYDERAYNHCDETQAERVLVKDRANFCDYFEYAPDRQTGADSQHQSDYLKQLDDLFKK